MEAASEVPVPRRNPACLAKAPFCASPRPRPRHFISTSLVVQLEPPRLLQATKNWPDRNVSSSDRTHGTAFGGVKAGQCPVPLAAAEAKQGRHKHKDRKLPWPLWRPQPVGRADSQLLPRILSTRCRIKAFRVGQNGRVLGTQRDGIARIGSENQPLRLRADQSP